MTWVYHQKTGALRQVGGDSYSGYSGHGDGVNNPSMQDVHNVGPVPQGVYSIGQPLDPIDHLGPLALPLTHVSGNIFGRDSFFIHGDNANGDHSASEGCIIMPRAARQAILDSKDFDLLVVI